MRKTEENAKASSMLVRCAALLRCLMKYNPTQSAIAHNPFRSALRAGKNIQRPAKSAEAWCTYSSHSRNDTARPLTTTIAPTTGRGLISACSMRTIKSQTSISEVVAESAFRVMDELRLPLIAVQKSGKRGFDKGSIIVSCDSL